MLYCHRWHRPAVLSEEGFARVVSDAQLIVGALVDHGVLLCGPDSEGEPVLDPDLIALNGDRGCGHPVDYRIYRTWPADHAGGIADPGENVSVARHGDTTLISMRACNGNCASHGLFLPRVLDLRYAEPAAHGFYAGECATQFKPYDLAVTAILLSLKHRLGDAVRIFSGGTTSHFWDARLLCFMLFGFGLRYEIVAGELVQKPHHRAETNSGENNNTNVP